jgi:toxin ParE1/3/4
MAEYRPSTAAEHDIQILFQSSQDMFGRAQTDIYMARLGEAFRNLADTPGMGRRADDLKHGLFRFRYQSHVIFYTAEPGQIVIQRVLHARMDFGSRL